MSAIPNLKSDNEELNAHWKNMPSARSPNTPQYGDSAVVSKELLHRIEQKFLSRVSSPPDNVRLVRELKEILKDCSTEGWDGYDAKPIDLVSVRWASNFISLLPEYVSYPELVPETNGELAMVWEKNGYHIVFGINSSGLISYGGVSPNGRIYGDATITENSSKISDEIIELLELVDRR